jgi:hypothetical protein
MGIFPTFSENPPRVKGRDGADPDQAGGWIHAPADSG